MEILEINGLRRLDKIQERQDEYLFFYSRADLAHMVCQVLRVDPEKMESREEMLKQDLQASLENR